MASAEQPSSRKAVIGGTESHVITSRGDGMRYRIDVALPWGNVKEPPPVLYALDGDASFPGACSSLRTMLFDSIVPPLLVVGIAQLGELRERAARRVRDFTTDEGVSGFLSVLREEILPFVEGRYGVDSGRRVLYGHSAAGLLVVHASFRDPGRFGGYIASSPALWRLGRTLFDFETKLAGEQPPRGKLFLSVGALEQPDGIERGALFQNVDRLRWFAKALRSRAYPELEVRDVVFPHDTHTTAAGPGLCHGTWWTVGRSLEEGARSWAPVPEEVTALLRDARVPTE